VNVYIARISHTIKDADCFFNNIEQFIHTLQGALNSPRCRWANKPHAKVSSNDPDLQLASGTWRDRESQAETRDITIPEPCTSFEQLIQGCLTEDSRAVSAGGTGWQLHLIYWTEDKRATREALDAEEDTDFDTPIPLKLTRLDKSTPTKQVRHKKNPRPHSLGTTNNREKKIKSEQITSTIKKEFLKQVSMNYQIII
jgi:hypothetical protein